MSNQVMLVEDNEETRNYVHRVLVRNKYDVIDCATGSEVMTRLNEGFGGLVLLDICLGQENGVEILKEIKQTHPKVPVVMLTSTIDESVGQQTLRIGASDYITKPFDLDRLYDVVQTYTFLASTPQAEPGRRKECA